jgi:hypothetical protein
MLHLQHELRGVDEEGVRVGEAGLELTQVARLVHGRVAPVDARPVTWCCIQRLRITSGEGQPSSVRAVRASKEGISRAC